MRTIVKGKNVDVADSDRQYAERKMQRLERLLGDRSEAIVELSREHHKSVEDSHIVEVTLVIDGRTRRGAASGRTWHAAIDAVIDKVERQAVDYREKPRLRARMPAARSVLRSLAAGTAEPASTSEGSSIVKIKRFAIEPMFEEDAVTRMEELGHSFFVFVNAENERLAVLYRRTDGNYGLIEPTIGGEYTKGRSRR
ncbi:MAG TPA: ribosome-associated translation inhibitor RaiA [Candidatus Limnocylindrales bacterium]|nr:ribosome-associated translation inhibitor RaiA [Candidatus Limnocylindrales bacterium]